MANYCKTGKKSTPTNKRLYNSIKNKIKKRAKVWPSAYASGQLVREYKSKGGKYNCSFGSLDRWFKEKWVNVCKPKGKSYETCGRKKSSWKNYPYCRPLKRINSSTPKTVGEIGKSKIREMCKKKRKTPRKKHSLKFGNKNISNNYNKLMYNGYNLGPTSSNLDSFYKNGTANSLNYDNSTKKCESANYGMVVTRFGKKSNFIQKANEMSRKKGTVGSFTRWCKRNGYSKVTKSCINKGKKNKSLKIRRRAIFAQHIIKNPRKKRKCSFGVMSKQDINEKKERYRNLSLEELHQEREYNLERYNKMLRIPGLSSEEIEDLKISYIDIIDEVIRKKEDEPNKIRNTIKNLGKRESGLWKFGKKIKNKKIKRTIVRRKRSSRGHSAQWKERERQDQEWVDRQNKRYDEEMAGKNSYGKKNYKTKNYKNKNYKNKSTQRLLKDIFYLKS